MPTAIRAITRVQDSDDFTGTPGAGTDAYALTYDNASQKFVLTQHATAADPHAGYLLATGARAGSASQAQKFGAAGISIAYDGSNLTTFATDSSGNLTITPSGRGIATKALHAGDMGVEGGNFEIISAQKSYTSAEVNAATSNRVILYEGHAKWAGDSDCPTKTVKGAHIRAQSWTANSLSALVGVEGDATVWAATPLTTMAGVSGAAFLSFAGSSATYLKGVDGLAYVMAGSATTVIGVYAGAYLPPATASTTNLAALQAEINSLGGSVSKVVGVGSKINSGAGTITDFYGFRLEPLPAATPTITNAYGLYLPAITLGGTLNYAIYAAGGASYFGGNVGIGATAPASRLDLAAGALTMQEMTAPSAPAANSVVIYAVDNGAGKTKLMALFPSGVAQQIAIEP